MKGVLFTGRNAVAYGDTPRPTLGQDDVLVEVKASGVCHTDFEVLRDNYGASAFPLVPGHEYAGVVVETGAAVTNVSVGARVVVDPNIECGACRPCRRGWAHLCETLGAYGVTLNGGFAEYSAVKASAVHPIGDMSFAQAALAEPMGCVLNGLDAGYKDWMETGLIFGAGPMGILMGLALKARGVKDVIFCDIDDSRLDLAARFGFSSVAAGSSELEHLRRSMDLVVDATGAPSVAAGLTDYAANGGAAHFFGVCPSDARIELSPFEVFRRQLTLVGSHSLNHNIPEALAVIASHGPEIEAIVSHTLPLEDVAHILSTAPPKGSLKSQAISDCL